MELYTVDIRSWTASFRYPNLISGIQPTLEVPPLSTVLGLINAAAGFYLPHTQLSIGYYFEYQDKQVDLETIYMIDSNKGKPTNYAKSNVIKREFLFENYLRLYVADEMLISYFKSPVFSLVLGRMNDLATVDITSFNKIDVEERATANYIRGQIIPFANNHLPGTVQALPKYFTDSIPRKNIGTEPYSVINCKTNVTGNCKAFKDSIHGKQVDIYLHHLNFEL